MADYKKLYAILFNKMSDIIEELIKTQQETEELYVGKSSTEGDRKRLARQNLLGADICPPEIEKELEIKKDKDIYGEYKNVLLSTKELEDLKKDYPNDYLSKIENLSSYMASSGKSYQNHLATIKLWSGKEKTNKQDYECEEGESL